MQKVTLKPMLSETGGLTLIEICCESPEQILIDLANTKTRKSVFDLMRSIDGLAVVPLQNAVLPASFTQLQVGVPDRSPGQVTNAEATLFCRSTDLLAGIVKSLNNKRSSFKALIDALLVRIQDSDEFHEQYVREKFAGLKSEHDKKTSDLPYFLDHLNDVVHKRIPEKADQLGPALEDIRLKIPHHAQYWTPGTTDRVILADEQRYFHKRDNASPDSSWHKDRGGMIAFSMTMSDQVPRRILFDERGYASTEPGGPSLLD